MRNHANILPLVPPDHPTTASATSPRSRRLTPVILACGAAVLLLIARRNAQLTRAMSPLASDKGTPSESIGAESSPLLSVWNLTPRQREVAQLILEHRDYSEIGRLCGVSLRTVQDDASHIFREASVKGRRDFERLMALQAPKHPASCKRP